MGFRKKIHYQPSSHHFTKILFEEITIPVIFERLLDTCTKQVSIVPRKGGRKKVQEFFFENRGHEMPPLWRFYR